MHVTDNNGYTFDISYTYRLISIDKSVANDKPGKASAAVSFQLSMSITNTTPQRNLAFQSYSGIVEPLNQPEISFAAVYNAESEVCQAIAERDGGSGDRPHCVVWLGYGRIPSGFGRDGVLELQVYAGTGAASGFRGNFAGVWGIDESSFDAVSSSLENPTRYVLVYWGPDGQRFGERCRKPNTAWFSWFGVGRDSHCPNV